MSNIDEDLLALATRISAGPVAGLSEAQARAYQYLLLAAGLLAAQPGKLSTLSEAMIFCEGATVVLERTANQLRALNAALLDLIRQRGEVSG